MITPNQSIDDQRQPAPQIPTQQKKNAPFKSAADVAAAGFRVFPIKPETKRPSVEGSFYSSTTDQAKIAAWIKEGRGGHLIGIETGHASDLVVLDADSAEAFAKMRARFGEPDVNSHRGGHWWFSHPGGGKVVTRIKFKPGLDCKGDGGYVLAPPGGGKSWTAGMPEKTKLRKLPEDMTCREPQPEARARELPEETCEAAAEAIASRVRELEGQGGGHDLVNALAGALLSRGVSDADAIHLLQRAWTKSGVPVLVERASHEPANSVATTRRRLASGENVTGIPRMEEITPGLFGELEVAFGWQKSPGHASPGGSEGAEASGEDGRSKRNAADRLLKYALAEPLELFVDQMGDPHALVDGSPLALNSRCYGWLRRLMLKAEGKAASGEHLKMTAGTLAAKAEVSGNVRELHTRAAFHEGCLYYELAPGRVAEVGAHGWKVREDAPVLFRRCPNLQPLAYPVSGGSLDALDDLVNLKSERDRRLFKAYAVTMLLPHVPRPIFMATGVMGSGKSTASRVLKRLCDPTEPESVRLDPREFLQKASHAHVVFVDNQSGVPEWAADTLCRLVTGEADSKRRLYTDDEDVIFRMKRAIILNAINVPTDRGDVLDRCMAVELERIPDTDGISEEVLWEKFEAAHPALLGAVFDALAEAMARKPGIELSRRPRLVDWGQYAAAVYDALGWGAGTFIEDWDEVVRVQNRATLDASPVAQAIIAFMNIQAEYSASAAELHRELKDIAEAQGVAVKTDKAWPKSANWLWPRIKEVQPLLEATGIVASRARSRDSNKITLVGRPPGEAGGPQSVGPTSFRAQPGEVTSLDELSARGRVEASASTNADASTRASTPDPADRTECGSSGSVEAFRGKNLTPVAPRSPPPNSFNGDKEICSANASTASTLPPFNPIAGSGVEATDSTASTPRTIASTSSMLPPDGADGRWHPELLALLESRPDWVRVQAGKCVEAEAPERLIRPLACSLAAHVLGNPRHGEEVLPFVQENLERLAT